MYCWRVFFASIGSLISVVIAIPIDNGVQGDPEIRCGDTSIIIKFQTRNPFEGHIFVKGHYGDQGCRTDESNNSKEAQISLAFNACGLRRARSANPRGIFVSSTVIITFHPQFVTKVDRAYAVQCFYMESEKTVTAELEVSMLTTVLQTQNVPMPICKYEVLDGGPTGASLRYAKIGDAVYHRWSCDSQAVDTFCMTVHSCVVDDGTGNKIMLLDANGCAQDRYLLGNLDYPTDLSAGRESHVFKYADKPSLFFNCQISINVKEPGTPCSRPQCAEPARGKRHVDNRKSFSPHNASPSSSLFARTETIDVDTDSITILDLEPSLEGSKVNRTRNVNQINPNVYTICMSYLGFSGYAAINVSLIIASVLMFVAAYRKSKRVVL